MTLESVFESTIYNGQSTISGTWIDGWNSKHVLNAACWYGV